MAYTSIPLLGHPQGYDRLLPYGQLKWAHPRCNPLSQPNSFRLQKHNALSISLMKH